jgi:hypothetical protein
LSRTTISLRISSIPAALVAHGDHKSTSRPIAASDRVTASISSSATPTPRAAAPRDSPIEA